MVMSVLTEGFKSLLISKCTLPNGTCPLFMFEAMTVLVQI